MNDTSASQAAAGSTSGPDVTERLRAASHALWSVWNVPRTARILQEREREAEGGAAERQAGPEAPQPFGGGPLPGCAPEFAPSSYLLEMPDAGPEAEPS